MIGFVLKLKKNKLLFGLVLFSLVVCFLDLIALVFNIIQISAMRNNAANFTGAMLPINIATITLNVVNLCLVIAYIVYTKIKTLRG